MAKEKLNPGHWHEATDRLHCVIEIISINLLEHSAILNTPEIKKLVDEAQEKLGEAYQLSGAKM